MKILFSPSETKCKGGKYEKISKDNFLFPDLYQYRMEAISKYQHFINTATNEQLAKLFGTKKSDVIDYYKGNLLEKKLMKAISRYNGVAYKYLQYSNLKDSEQKYIDTNVIIFSNLFGPILASNKVQDYKLKQAEKIDGFALEKYYKEHFTNHLDKFLENEDIIDLRAGFYNKFYKPSSSYTTLKFLKNGKVVSHWAKAYRGIVLRELAINHIETLSDFKRLEIDGLMVREMIQKGFHLEIVFDIINDH